jgi:hypothetical protein
MRFSRRLSKEEISDYLGKVSKYELDTISLVVLEDHLSEKGLKSAARGKKLLKKHGALFAGCTSGSDLGEVVRRTVDKWPDVSPDEYSLVSDLVKAHRESQRDA